MHLSKPSNDFINLFYPVVNKIKSNTIKSDKILKEFYKKIYLSSQYADMFMKNNEIVKKTIEVDMGNKMTELDKYVLLKEGEFVPRHIKKKIYSSLKSIDIYTFSIDGIEINFHHFFTTINVKIDKHTFVKNLKNIVLLYHLLLSYYKSINIKSLKITLIPTNLKKNLPNIPGKILSSDNINTALTYSCKKDGEILLYRYEEWFKVLTHESMHAICYDFGKLNMGFDIKNTLQNMFNVNSDFYITESYSEYWANIINTGIKSFIELPNKKSYDEFLLNFNVLHNFERIFSLFQCIKILDYMKLSYSDITSKNIKIQNKCLSIYREDSNVFAYYILKAIWLFHSDIFLLWFDKHNTFLIYTDKSTKYVKDILSLTKKYYTSKDLLDIIKKIETVFFAIKKEKTIGKDLQYNIIDTLQMSLF